MNVLVNDRGTVDRVVLVNGVPGADLNEAAIAAFPPPHTFFWAREVEINVGYNWYRKDEDGSFSFVPGMTLADAIAQAGGMTSLSRSWEVILVRKTKGEVYLTE